MTQQDNSLLADTNSFSTAEQFPLLRRFAITSLVAMLVTAIVLVTLYRQDQLVEHKRISERRNEQAATQLIHLLGKQINTLAVSSERLDTQTLRNNPSLALFPSGAEMVRDYDILKLKIFNRSGIIIYSSVKNDIGGTSNHPAWQARALSGEVSHKQEFRDTFLGATGEMHGIHLAVTYMPLVYEGQPIGAIEIYRDATPVFEHLNANTIQIPLIVFGGFSLLFAALFFYVRRTDRTIAKWQQALLESENRRHLLEQQELVQTSLDGFFVARTTDTRILDANEAFCCMVGYSREELLTMRLSDLEAEESPAKIAAHIKKIMESGYDRFETRHRHKRGQLIDIEISVSHSEMNGGMNFVFARDITGRKFNEQYEQFRSHILELLSGDDSLEDILEGIVRGVEQLSPGMICSILLLDSQGKHLGKGIAPSLPDFYNAAIEGIEIGIGIGSCGTAAASGERVIVADIQTHPYWAGIKELAAKAGLGACWSQPILSSSGQVLGTFAIYHHEVHTPTASDISIIEQAAHLASIAIERKQAFALLLQRERELRTFAENMPDNIVRYNREGVTVYVNPVLERTLGDFAAAMIGTTPRQYHPDGSYEDYAQLLDAVLASGEASELEKMFLGPDGNVSFHQIRMVPERGENGELVGVLSIGRDITERKRVEEALASRERELRALAESSPGMMGSFYLRPDGSMCMPYVSSKIWGHFGLTPQEVAVDATPLMARTHPDDAQMVQKSIEVSALTLTTWHVEYRILHPTKGERWMESNTNPEPQPDGGVIWYGYIHDITGRKTAEEALRASEQQFRTLAENLPDILIRYDREGRRTYVNPAMERIFAVQDKRMVGLTVQEANPLLLPESYQLALQHTLATGERSEFEMQLPAASGDAGIGFISITAERAENGQIFGAIVVGRDITERKQAEEALRASEQRFRSLAENMPDTLIRYDLEGRRTYINPALKRISAVRDEQMIGLMQQESNPFVMPEIYRLALEHTLATGERSELELAIPTPSGDIRTNSVFIVAEREADAQISGAITIGRDITERKQAEEALRASEQRFRSLAENMPFILMRYDREGRRTYVNPSAERNFGFVGEQIIGKTLPEINPLKIPTVEAYQRALKHTLATGERSEFEMQVTVASGEVRIGNTVIVAEWAADGQISGAITIGRDITKLKQVEQQLRELAAHIQTVREEEKARLAREIHDDLGSTLAALKLRLSHLLDFELSEEMKKTPMFTRFESMSQILDSAIAASRRIVTDMRPEILDNLGLFAALKWQAEQFQQHSGIECQFIFAGEHRCIDCKNCEHGVSQELTINLFRIFQEALTNVGRHSGASKVEVEFRPGSDEVVFSIRDNGCGLPDGHIIPATSFGMRGMRERVWQLGGSLEFDSPPGGGLRVTVRVPLPLPAACTE